MSFIQQILKHHDDMMSKLIKVDGEIMSQWMLIDAEEEKEKEKEIARDHFCDCEYCPYQDVVIKPMSAKEKAAIEKQIDKLTDTKNSLKKTITRLESYAKSVGAPVPDDKLLKNQSRRVR